MAVIHDTTLKPTKLELLTAWLPSRPWYQGGEGEPELAKAGGFRLDDPQGAVGIEFLVATDTSGDRPVDYLLPMTYRGAPLEGAEHALIGTMEHGVLGRRWAYDGYQDPVLVAQLAALLAGRVQAQDQNDSDVPDREVTRSLTGDLPAGTEFAAAVDHREGTDLPAPDGAALRLVRVLRPAADLPAALPPQTRGHLAGCWNLSDGTRAQGLFAVLWTAPGPESEPAGAGS